MTIVDWLPREALRESAVTAVVAAPVEEWSHRWFVDREITTSVLRQENADGASSPKPALRFQKPGLLVELPPRGKRHLLEALLDVELTTETLSEGDRHVLDVLAGEVAEDLAASLAKDLGNVESGGDQVRIAIAIAENNVLQVSIAQHGLVPLVKRNLGRTVRPHGPLGNRLKAIHPTRLIARGVLGRVELTVTELKDLAVGDVLILDRSLNEPAELHAADSGRLIARGKLQRSGGRISVQL